MANEAFGATEMEAFKRGVLETETRLAEEVARLCKDYYAKVWAKSLSRAGVPVNSELRRTKNI